MSVFICRENSKAYYLAKGSSGSFLCPPGHPNHSNSIVTKRVIKNLDGSFFEGSVTGFASIDYCAEEDSHFPAAVKLKCRELLANAKMEATEQWLEEVYRYFAHCYSPDGKDRNVSNCLVVNGKKQKELFVPPPEHSLAYLCVKEYFPDYPVRGDLIANWK